MNLKNIAGNDVSVFLFRFELRGNGVDFVLNEAIAADMYQDVDNEIKPLVHACCETLLRYRQLSVGNTIMDGNILATGDFEVMLSKGLGRHFAHDEKERLFQDAKNISDLLTLVMDRRTQGVKEGKQGDFGRIKRAAGPQKDKGRASEAGKRKTPTGKIAVSCRWWANAARVKTVAS